MDKNFIRAYWSLGQPYVQMGKFDEAIAAFRKAMSLSDHPLSLALLCHACGLSGRRSEAIEALDQLEAIARSRYVSPYFFALAHIGLGDNDRALTWLEKVYKDRFWVLAFVRTEPTFDPLRRDERFEQFARKVEAARII